LTIADNHYARSVVIVDRLFTRRAKTKGLLNAGRIFVRDCGVMPKKPVPMSSRRCRFVLLKRLFDSPERLFETNWTVIEPIAGMDELAKLGCLESSRLSRSSNHVDAINQLETCSTILDG